VYRFETYYSIVAVAVANSTGFGFFTKQTKPDFQEIGSDFSKKTVILPHWLVAIATGRKRV